jgi:DNA-binding TFAR19-related protein (PDSD5 family)
MGDAFCATRVPGVQDTGAIRVATTVPSQLGVFMVDANGRHITVAPEVEAASSSLSAVMRAADLLARSAEPDVVFESLVQRCAPLVCDAATATVARPDGRIYATSWPAGALTHRWQPESVVAEFNAPAAGDYAGFHGLVSFRFPHQEETRPYVAQLLVERALANVERERLTEAAASRKAAKEHLELALSSNREIGIAVGVLMANHKLTDDQAFDLLSRVSQRTNRKLRVIALEVARAGMLELPAGVEIIDREARRPRRLTSVPGPGLG